MLKIKNLNSFYIMVKMYSNEPKINHHSIWAGIGQHLRTLQTSFSLLNLYNGYVYKNTPEGLRNDRGVHKCCSNPVKPRWFILGLLEYILTIVKKEFRFLTFCLFHRPYRRIWKPLDPMYRRVTIDQFHFFFLLRHGHGLDLLHISRSRKK